MRHVCKSVTGNVLRHLVVVFMAPSVLAMATQVLAFPVAPTTLAYNASSTTPTPSSQRVTFSKTSLVPRPWTASGSAAWLSVSPASGTIAREQDQVAVQVNASGLAAGTYSGTVSIAITEKNNGTQITTVPVTLVITSGSSSLPVTPSILLNPTSLVFLASWEVRRRWQNPSR